MQQDLVKQPSVLPTRKMLAVAVAGVIGAALTQWFDQLATLTAWLAWLSADATKAAVPVLAGFLAGYIVRERAAPSEAPSQPGDWPQSQARLQTAPLAGSGGAGAGAADPGGLRHRARCPLGAGAAGLQRRGLHPDHLPRTLRRLGGLAGRRARSSALPDRRWPVPQDRDGADRSGRGPQGLAEGPG